MESCTQLIDGYIAVYKLNNSCAKYNAQWLFPAVIAAKSIHQLISIWRSHSLTINAVAQPGLSRWGDLGWPTRVGGGRQWRI